MLIERLSFDMSPGSERPACGSDDRTWLFRLRALGTRAAERPSAVDRLTVLGHSAAVDYSGGELPKAQGRWPPLAVRGSHARPAEVHEGPRATQQTSDR